MARKRVVPAFGLIALAAAQILALHGFAQPARAEAAPTALTPEQQKRLEYERTLREQQAARGAESSGPAYARQGIPDNPDPHLLRQQAGGKAPVPSNRSGTSPSANARPQTQRPTEPQVDHGYVSDAIIDSIVPIYLQPDGRVAVNLKIELARQISSAELAAQLRILIDGEKIPTYSTLEDVATPDVAEPASPAAQRPASGSASENASTTTGRPLGEPSRDISVTVFGRVPAGLAPATKFSVAVYSKLDGRIIATSAAETPPAATVPKPGEPGSFWSKYGWWAFLVLLISVAVLGKVIASRERRAKEHIKTLEETVQSTRSVLGAVTGEAPRQAGSSGGDAPAIQKVDVPPVVLEALERGELGIVVGAAASLYANLPIGASLWLAIIERFRTELSDAQRAQLQKLIAESGSDAAIEPLLSLVGRDKVLQALAAELSMERASPKDFHRHLATLAQLGARRYVDLGWDGVLDTILRSVQARAFSSRNFTGLSEALRASEVTLIKPYGEISEPGGISLTAQEFRRQLSQSPELERCLASLFSAQTLLFVGMNTKAIEQFLSGLPPQLESSGREHFALVPFDWSLELWSQGFAKRYGITVLPVDADGSAESATEALGRIAGDAQQRRASRAPSKGKQSDFTGIGTVRSVQLRNIGNFKSIDVDFHEHWNLLLGDNGGGKSTILRALTLALSGNDARGEAMAARLLRNGEGAGSIEMNLGANGATKIRTVLVRDGTRVKITSPQVTPLQAGQGLVLGFPALRGVTTTQPTGPTRMSAADPNVDDVAPLLQEKVDTRLNQLKQWVINTALQAESAPNGREAQMFKTFRRVLRDVVPGRHVDFHEVDRTTWTVLLQTDDGIVSFDSLSQGTSSILGWIGVLLQRLYDIYPNAKKPEDGPALLLIDEIDAHLHPRWQRKLVTLTREQFPNVQMISSSHSPLLAGAMRREELRIVERDPASGEMRALMPREDLSGQTADQILTSSLFALPTSRSPEAETKIRGYFKLYEKPNRTPDEDQELRKLEEELDQLNYGPTRQMRETQQALQQSIKAQLDAITPEMAAAISARVGSARTRKEETA